VLWPRPCRCRDLEGEAVVISVICRETLDFRLVYVEMLTVDIEAFAGFGFNEFASNQGLVVKDFGIIKL
jgi:hypothetical protein